MKTVPHYKPTLADKLPRRVHALVTVLMLGEKMGFGPFTYEGLMRVLGTRSITTIRQTIATAKKWHVITQQYVGTKGNMRSFIALKTRTLKEMEKVWLG